MDDKGVLNFNISLAQTGRAILAEKDCSDKPQDRAETHGRPEGKFKTRQGAGRAILAEKDCQHKPLGRAETHGQPEGKVKTRQGANRAILAEKDCSDKPLGRAETHGRPEGKFKTRQGASRAILAEKECSDHLPQTDRGKWSTKTYSTLKFLQLRQAELYWPRRNKRTFPLQRAKANGRTNPRTPS
ncbi:hypothetical protein NE237_027321 [Protea cynaroides]|uniref:Uncharacterized protein n=1 Tax=Protea cynaroides TaxID=273540 RepID=A0A9Q0GNB8_9MAGN|nr:hypothetical protein NE237_027321 [Protea cynaroides]